MIQPSTRKLSNPLGCTAAAFNVAGYTCTVIPNCFSGSTIKPVPTHNIVDQCRLSCHGIEYPELPLCRGRCQQGSSPQRARGASPMRHSTSVSSSHMQSAYGQPLQLRPSGRVASNAAVTMSSASIKPQAPMHAASLNSVQSSSDRIAAVQGSRRHSSTSINNGNTLRRSGSQK